VSLRGNIRECQEYAEACTHIAACAADAKTRDDILRLKRSWLSLAKCLALLPPQSNFNRPANGRLMVTVSNRITTEFYGRSVYGSYVLKTR
jgi:hypothetical protein